MFNDVHNDLISSILLRKRQNGTRSSCSKWDL